MSRPWEPVVPHVDRAADPGSGVNAVRVAGGRGVLLVDPWAGAALPGDPPTHVVCTHPRPGLAETLVALRREHPAVEVWAHESAGLPATHLLSSVAALDLGARLAEVVHPGPGHTAADLVVRVADLDLVLTGALVTADPPSYVAESRPLDWPDSIDLLVGLTTPASVIVPGRGGVVDVRFVQDRRADLITVAEALREAAAHGVPPEEAADRPPEGGWPFPREVVLAALRAGYEQVPREPRRLPLV